VQFEWLRSRSKQRASVDFSCRANKQQDDENMITETDAREAVRDAIKTLVGSGIRAHCFNVPKQAEDILFSSGEGTITLAEAREGVKKAIPAMVALGELKAYDRPHEDWKLLTEPADARIVTRNDPDFEERCQAEARLIAHEHTKGARQKYDEVYEHELQILLKKDSFTPRAS
jgi:hypothetical protein